MSVTCTRKWAPSRHRDNLHRWPLHDKLCKASSITLKIYRKCSTNPWLEAKSSISEECTSPVHYSVTRTSENALLRTGTLSVTNKIACDRTVAVSGIIADVSFRRHRPRKIAAIFDQVENDQAPSDAGYEHDEEHAHGKPGHCQAQQWKLSVE